MDIQEAKKFAKNKIEADALTKQVRDIIKITKWEKQNMREGFKETFKPLIKSQDSIKKSIDEQQNATIAQLKKNQLALTRGLQRNRLALTSGLEKINETNLRLAEMSELPALEGDYDEPTTSRPRSPTRYNIEKNLDNVDLGVLKDMGYPRPNDFFDTNPERLREIRDEVKNDVKTFTGQIAGLKRKKQKTEDEKNEIKNIQMQKDLLHNYKNNLELYLDSLEYKMGEGIYFNNPHQLLDRLELLGGSLAAGNNGVLSEYIQIAHRLRDLGVINNKKLNTLLRKYISI